MSDVPVDNNRTENIDIDDAVEKLQHYWDTYTQQSGYQGYSDQTFIDDALYAIGLAINKDKFQHAQGYDLFKLQLRIYLLQTMQD